MRRYDDPVEVRRGPVQGHGAQDHGAQDHGGQEMQGQESPAQFMWRGRLWKVRAVVARWVETGPWWQSARARAVTGEVVGDGDHLPEQREWGQFAPDLLVEREVWRVEAGRPGGRSSLTDGPTNGVFDLSYDAVDGRWQLVGCLD